MKSATKVPAVLIVDAHPDQLVHEISINRPCTSGIASVLWLILAAFSISSGQILGGRLLPAIEIRFPLQSNSSFDLLCSSCPIHCSTFAHLFRTVWLFCSSTFRFLTACMHAHGRWAPSHVRVSSRGTHFCFVTESSHHISKLGTVLRMVIGAHESRDIATVLLQSSQ